MRNYKIYSYKPNIFSLIFLYAAPITLVRSTMHSGETNLMEEFKFSQMKNISFARFLHQWFSLPSYTLPPTRSPCLILLVRGGHRGYQTTLFVAYFAPSCHKTDKILPFASSGQNSWWGARMLISLVEFQSRNILRFVSNTRLVSSLISQQDGCIQRDLPNALQHHDDLHR